MTGQSGGWIGSTADAMRIDPTFWPTCEWNVFTPGAAEEQPNCHNPGVWILTYEHEFRVVLCDEHLAERPTHNNNARLLGRFTRHENQDVVAPSDYFALSMDELREVTRFAAQGAQEVLEVFERANPEDGRARAAIEAAWEFANGARRTMRQRVTALDAHRAAKDAPTEAAKHAAHAAGDAAASAYLHPFAKADQVSHILRADANAAYAEELLTGDPALGVERIARAAARATPLLVDVLRRYPRAPVGRSRVSSLMKRLDDELRTP